MLFLSCNLEGVLFSLDGATQLLYTEYIHNTFTLSFLFVELVSLDAIYVRLKGHCDRFWFLHFKGHLLEVNELKSFQRSAAFIVHCHFHNTIWRIVYILRSVWYYWLGIVSSIRHIPKVLAPSSHTGAFFGHTHKHSIHIDLFELFSIEALWVERFVLSAHI